MKLAKIESGVRTIIDFTDAFNRRDVAGMLACLTSDCQFEAAGPAPDGQTLTGVEAIGGYWQAFFEQHPQARLEIEDLVSLGFRGLRRWRCEWVDADAKSGTIRGVDVFEIRGHLIRRMLSYTKS